MDMREAMEAARPAYEAAQAALAEQAKTCRYCKGAKTRALKKFNRMALTFTDAEYVSRLEQAERAMCKEHTQRSRLNFACSPVSENYWSS